MLQSLQSLSRYGFYGANDKLHGTITNWIACCFRHRLPWWYATDQPHLDSASYAVPQSLFLCCNKYNVYSRSVATQVRRITECLYSFHIQNTACHWHIRHTFISNFKEYTLCKTFNLRRSSGFYAEPQQRSKIIIFTYLYMTNWNLTRWMQRQSKYYPVKCSSQHFYVFTRSQRLQMDANGVHSFLRFTYMTSTIFFLFLFSQTLRQSNLH